MKHLDNMGVYLQNFLRVIVFSYHKYLEIWNSLKILNKNISSENLRNTFMNFESYCFKNCCENILEKVLDYAPSFLMVTYIGLVLYHQYRHHFKLFHNPPWSLKSDNKPSNCFSMLTVFVRAQQLLPLSETFKINNFVFEMQLK